jgi:hypothetical protein
VSKVVDYDPSDFASYFFLLGFYLRDFAAHSDGASPADVGVVFYFVTLNCILFYIIIIIILFCNCVILFI